MKLAEAAAVYEVSARATATRETVASPVVHRFATTVRRMNRAIDPSNEDELWGSFIRRCRRTLRDLSITPLSPSHPVFDLDSSVAFLEGITEQARPSYPEEVVARADLCVAALADVAGLVTNQLGDLISEILNTGDLRASGLLVKTRQLDAVQRWLGARAPGVRLVTEGEITGLTALESLVVVGPSYWFPAHLLSAPRAEAICFVHYGFLRDREHETRLLQGSHPVPGIRIRSVAVAETAGDADDQMEADLLVPTVDWNALAKATGVRLTSSSQDLEAVRANLFLLADGHSVYLEAADGPTIDVVVDVEPGREPRLASQRTRLIEPGHYIVLRTEGGSGDYIPGIADARLGRRAARLRALQIEWKSALRRKVLERGFLRVERDLGALGIKSPNLRYRLWKHSLRSQNPNDFRILMEYIDLGDRAAEIWNAMIELFEAHLRAGQDVRKMLEKAVIAADTDRLIQTGRVDVRLPEMEAGTLSVVRVDGRSPETQAVGEDDLRVMARVAVDLWQG